MDMLVASDVEHQLHIVQNVFKTGQRTTRGSRDRPRGGRQILRRPVAPRSSRKVMHMLVCADVENELRVIQDIFETCERTTCDCRYCSRSCCQVLLRPGRARNGEEVMHVLVRPNKEHLLCIAIENVLKAGQRTAGSSQYRSRSRRQIFYRPGTARSSKEVMHMLIGTDVEHLLRFSGRNRAHSQQRQEQTQCDEKLL